MTDIQKMIEEEAHRLASEEFDEDTKRFDDIKSDLLIMANFALTQLQHANRWRKVSEELPEKGIQVLVRNKYGVCHVAHLLINGWDYVFEFPPVEWKPIE